MKKILPYIIGILITIFATFPPIDFRIEAPNQYFPWIVLICGFFGFYTLFLRVPTIVKTIAIGFFISCFFSTIPLASFIAYFSLIFCVYFFIACLEVEDDDPIFKILQCLLFLHFAMFFLQFINHDPLLNFSERSCFGIIGQHMQSSSFSVILAAALLPYHRLNLGFPFIISLFCNSAGGFLSAIAGLSMFFKEVIRKRFKIPVIMALIGIFIAWILIGGKWHANTNDSNGRSKTWLRTVELSLEHPIKGYGIGTYQYLFPPLSQINSFPWKTAHNCWLQILFETGMVGLLIFFGYFIYLFTKLIKLLNRAPIRNKALMCLSGLLMIAVNMCVHFPTRMISTIFIIIFFLAYCQKVVNYGILENSDS